MPPGYGDEIPIDVATTIAPLLIVQELGDPDIDIPDIIVEDPIRGLDAFGVETSYVFAFTAPQGHWGYVVIASHTRAPVLMDFNLGQQLPHSESLFYFSQGELYFATDGDYTLISGETLPEQEFQTRQVDVQRNLSQLPSDLLDQIEFDTLAQISPYLEGDGLEILDFESTANYNGQDTSSRTTGLYGRISNPTSYLAHRYKATNISTSSSKLLSVPYFHMDAYGGANDCVPIAITRTFDYLRTRGYGRIPASRATIYKDVEASAKRHGFTNKSGTNPVNIDNIMKDVATKYGYRNTTVRGIYVWSYGGTVVPEINAGRPLLWNIARGHYANHTVTVTGYRTYKYKVNGKSQSRPFVAVADSWKTSVRWVDYNAFAYDLVSAGVGSFNTMQLKG